MGKGKHNLTEQQAKHLKNEQYKKNEITFISDHSKHCNLFSISTELEHGKLIAIYTCKRCRISKTFYFNV